MQPVRARSAPLIAMPEDGIDVPLSLRTNPSRIGYESCHNVGKLNEAIIRAKYKYRLQTIDRRSFLSNLRR